MSAYFDALGTVFSGLAHALPQIATVTLALLAVPGWLALLSVPVFSIEGDPVGWRVKLFGILAGPVNTLLVVAPLIVHLNGAV